MSDTAHSAKRPDEICMEGDGYEPDPSDYTRLQGSRETRWGQDRALMDAGLPDGVLNVVNGDPVRISRELIESPHIRAVSFTGSQEVGPSVAAAAVKTGARVQLEMGGKNPLIVLDDADLATAVSVAINGAFFQAGQRCTASSRLIVTDGIHDRFVDAMTARMKTLVIDDALKAGTEIGPVVDQRQLDKNFEYVELGKKEGAGRSALPLPSGCNRSSRIGSFAHAPATARFGSSSRTSPVIA